MTPDETAQLAFEEWFDSTHEYRDELCFMHAEEAFLAGRESLRQENERLREALETLQRYFEKWGVTGDDRCHLYLIREALNKDTKSSTP